MKLVYILAAILIFGLLVAIHELGHFLAAKLCGVKVNEFSIGMGPLVWHKETEETQYSLRALPLGGFCAMEGETEESEDERGFLRQGFWKKLLILAAGSLMNFLAGVLILLVLYAGTNYVLSDVVVGLAPEFEQTGEYGLMEGDRIYKVNGYRTYLQGDASLFLSYAGETADLEVVRDGRHIRLEDLPRRTYTSMDGVTPYTGFGIYVGVQAEEATLLGKLQYTAYNALDFVQLVWFSLAQIIGGNAGMQDLSGPVGIVSTITEVGVQAETALDAWSQIFYFAAMLAVNLAVMNLLPLPALDGGQIFFLAVDSACLLLFKRKIPQKYQAWVNTFGFALLMGLMLMITFNDVFRLFQ